VVSSNWSLSEPFTVEKPERYQLGSNDSPVSQITPPDDIDPRPGPVDGRSGRGEPSPGKGDRQRGTTCPPPCRSWLCWSIPLLCVLTLFLILRPDPRDSFGSHVAVGKPTPEFNLVRLTDEMRYEPIMSPAEGEIVLLHFWGTWCPPCRMEFPALVALVGRQADSGFRFVPVSCGGRGEPLDTVWRSTTQYYDDENITSPAFADPRGHTQLSSADRLEQTSLYFPTSILIGPDRRIAGVWEGYTPSAVEQIESSIARLRDQD